MLERHQEKILATVGLVPTCRTVGQIGLGDVRNPLEVIVAGIAEVGCSEAEEDGHRTAVATLVLQEVCAMLGAHLQKDYNTLDI